MILGCIHPLEITYILGPGGRSITFYPCWFTSHHPEDVAQKYCAVCHRWMDLIELARRMHEEASR
jgi:CRISPR/Cas system-associated protein Cas10 (large subunit of type III CRISPR-Cas system)